MEIDIDGQAKSTQDGKPNTQGYSFVGSIALHSRCFLATSQLGLLCGSPLLLAGRSSATVAQTGGLALRARHAILETAELASRSQPVQGGNQDQSSACAGPQHVGTSPGKAG